uniref:C2H2-type domain-containing protein n=1 Tax=Mesocestoides corti TaxID=53468 RepID=A0A5K3FCZ6_MESCO
METEYVAPETLLLSECNFCHRRFFPESLQKHEPACEREWMRSNCPKEKKNAAAPGPFIQGHVTGYYVKVKTFADMLALGAERRMRWRMRHEEFLHSVRTAKVNYLKERGEIVPDVKPLSPTITQAGM